MSSDDILTPQDIVTHWHLVEAADKLEVDSFVTHDVFKLHSRQANDVDNMVDAIWVRRFKSRNPLVVKSRMCGRGFMDRQKTSIDKHSSTASRVSHRLAVSQSVVHDLEMETADISTAFLQGMKFQDLMRKAQRLGYEPRKTRRVWLCPPANVWRHLRNNAKCSINVSDADILFFCLLLLKAIYGLVDGPLLFQLALLDYLTSELPLVRSLHDENYLYYASGWRLIAVFVIHVDDLLISGDENSDLYHAFVDWMK